jgi:hypothetical protein
MGFILGLCSECPAATGGDFRTTSINACLDRGIGVDTNERVVADRLRHCRQRGHAVSGAILVARHAISLM